MTNKEAIEVFKGFKFLPREQEAVELAIKALEERPQGEWILKEKDYDVDGNNLYECTNCHHSDTHSESVDVPYCWHCGAYMGGNKDETEN